jgi:hypothetical protein
MADVDEANTEIVLLIHWTGGRHSELRIKKNLTGKHSRCTNLEAIEIIRRMAGRFPDDQIAATLNRLAFRTGTGNTWNEGRVRSVRSYHQLPVYDAKTSTRKTLTLEEASERLAVSHKVVRRLIESKKISATQVVPWAPWEIPAEAIVFRLGWKWKERSAVKITERTREETKKALHRRREGRHLEATFAGEGADLQAL